MAEKGIVWSKSEVMVVVAIPIEVFKGLLGTPVKMSPAAVEWFVPVSSKFKVPIKFCCIGGL